MPENRTTRTEHLGLLALMQSPAGGGPASSVQGWGFPYWNQVWLDALLAALHEAARDGVVALTAPATGPTLALSASPGYLPAGLTLEVAQTWVDEWGRETAAGTVSQVSTGEAITDPAVAPTLGTPTAAASGFDGGLLEVAYSWIDEAAGETISSPTSQVDIPYRTGGLQSEVVVTLPATPVSVGAAGAFIYARHRSGNWVRAAAISDPAEDEVTLDGTWISCFVALPLANSTGAGKAIDITGIEAPAAAALTRFYVRAAGEAWTSGDRRLCISGADEWDPASIAYPLIYTGAASGLAPGYPPPVTQVKALRQIDLVSETIGTLPADQLPQAAVLEEELVRSTGEGIVTGLAVGAHDPADMGVAVTPGEALNTAGRWAFATATDIVLPAADPDNPRIDLVCLADDGTLEGPTQNAALQGTPAAEPSAPEVPEGYLALAEILVDAEVTSVAAEKITDRRTLLRSLSALYEAILERALAADLVSHASDTAVHFTGTEKADCLLTALQKTDLTDGGETALHTHPGLGSSGYLTNAINGLETWLWAGEIYSLLYDLLVHLRSIEYNLAQTALLADELRQISANSSRRTFTDEERACPGSTTTDFALEALDEGLLVRVQLVANSAGAISFDFKIYRDSTRTSLVKEWTGLSDSSDNREVLDWLNEDSPQQDDIYCRVVNASADALTLTTTLTLKEA